MKIIGYIHVCQKGEWERSFDLLMESVRSSGLYEEVYEIRIGVVNTKGVLIPNERFNDAKIKIIYVGKEKEYERPTLLHMKQSSFKEDVFYFYLHTKGISHFNTKFEKPVIHWIRDMLYWNIELWRKAVIILKKYDTYGCNYGGIHYSGNFWWATSNHIKTLPNRIPSYYTAPEDWVTLQSKKNDNFYCAHNCKPHFKSPYPKKMYTQRNIKHKKGTKKNE